MAAELTEEAEEEKPGKKKAIIMLVLLFLGVTALAAGAGFGAAMFLKPQQQEVMDKGSNQDGMADGESEEDAEAGEEGEAGGLEGYAQPLAPILTNLAAPKDVWVRLEVAVVADTDTTRETLEEVHQDLLAYMRTARLHQVEGPSGYLNLRAELDDRAAIRSGGKVSRVLVRTIVFE